MPPYIVPLTFDHDMIAHSCELLNAAKSYSHAAACRIAVLTFVLSQQSEPP